VPLRTPSKETLWQRFGAFLLWIPAMTVVARTGNRLSNRCWRLQGPTPATIAATASMALACTLMHHELSIRLRLRLYIGLTLGSSWHGCEPTDQSSFGSGAFLNNNTFQDT
jgi:hypothetical protein